MRDDVSGAVLATYSLVGDDTGATITNNGGSSQIGSSVMPIDPLLGPLADNGGPTRTHALLAGSPAINMGDSMAAAGMGGVPFNDQRGLCFRVWWAGR